MKFAAATVVALLAGFTLRAEAAGQAEVSFLPPEKYTDVGVDAIDRERNLQVVADHLQQLATKRLRDGQTLKVSFLDIDLAGRPNLMHRSAGDFRILTGEADWPRMRLHWSLSTPGEPPREGDAELADMNYLWSIRTARSDTPLYYDLRMLDGWFTKTFGSAIEPKPTP